VHCIVDPKDNGPLVYRGPAQLTFKNDASIVLTMTEVDNISFYDGFRYFNDGSVISLFDGVRKVFVCRVWRVLMVFFS
jgi:hypothetical protein